MLCELQEFGWAVTIYNKVGMYGLANIESILNNV